MEWIYPTAFSKWDMREHAAIDRVVQSGKLTMGPEVAAFEREFADYHGMKHCVMVNSGSSANLIMIAALTHYGRVHGENLKRGERAYVPAIAWSTTYAPLIQYGLDLVIVDVDDTWNASLSTLRDRNVRMQRGVIVGCSILGNPAWSEIWATAAAQSASFYVEDNCESFGAVSQLGHKCGTLGLMNSFSFFYSHQISAVEGGAVLTNDEECCSILRQLRAHGWTRDTPDLQKDTFEGEYDFRLPGYNVRPTEIYAAVARVQLRKQEKFRVIRQENMRYFRDGMFTRDIPARLPVLTGEVDPFGLHFELLSNASRKRVVLALRERGVDCRLPTGGSFGCHAYGEKWKSCPTPRADQIHECGLFIGNGPIDLRDKIDLALDIIKEAA